MSIKTVYLWGIIMSFSICNSLTGQETDFRNPQLEEILTPFSIPLSACKSDIKYKDLDKDGDPDILMTTIYDDIPILWIDDDDDMKKGDVQGDMDNDCVMLDLNKDGEYGSYLDLMVDYIDTDGDGTADVQAILDYNKKGITDKWSSHYIWFMDDDNDGVFGYIDWKTLKFEGWDHDGRANFFTDYNGKSTMLKVHISTIDIESLDYSWENPFLYYDTDNDGLSEMAIRCVDEPLDNHKDKSNKEERRWEYSKMISKVQMTWDMDNDAVAGNELDYDLSLQFRGKGFNYEDQVHPLNGIKGLKEADYLFLDSRWRHLDQLVYPSHETAYDLTFGRGEWDHCWMVFDEDDDCQRWERVEFYDPKDPYKIGTKNGGLDHNPQADASGDRGEWDADFSGKGNLYLSPLDGKIHLLGAEHGYWRIDQNSLYYQGWQGWRGENLQPEDFENIEPIKFAIIKYEDTDNNGFMDKMSYDMDGDQTYESVISLDKGQDKGKVYTTKDMGYEDMYQLYQDMAKSTHAKANKMVEYAKSLGLNTDYYNFYKSPKSLREKYHNSYWMSYYIYQDLLSYCDLKKDKKAKKKIISAFHNNGWEL